MDYLGVAIVVVCFGYFVVEPICKMYTDIKNNKKE